jgi:probable rRNA maturation factor
VAISFHNEGISFRLKEKNKHKRWIGNAIALHQKRTGQIAYIFTSNEQLLLMNREYLNHNYFTDVITFDYSTEEILSGDIYISVEQVFLNADDYGSKALDELRRVMIHGVLHLAGYRDSTGEERRKMRKLENEALNLWLKTV